MLHNHLKDVLDRGEVALGSIISIESPDLMEIYGLAGFDFVMIDGEHGPLTQESALPLIRAAELHGMSPIVRIPDMEDATIKHHLDVGAHGLQIPQCDDADMVRKAVARAKYSPAGCRGTAMPRSTDYGFSLRENPWTYANENTLIMAQCESVEGLKNLEEICQIDAVDMIFFGPFDMSASLGVIGQTTHPEVLAAEQKVLTLCKKYHKAAGTFVMDGKAAKEKAAMGYQFLEAGIDTLLFAGACRQIVQDFRG